MKLNSEMYRGVTIRVLQNILGGKKIVIAKWMLKGRKFELKGLTKVDVVSRAKKAIDNILGKR